ncbi:MAG: hypothetical protein IPF96_15655 [Rhodobacter sp.]|nr:hypothetical protein [Rhodobacter sp.]
MRLIRSFEEIRRPLEHRSGPRRSASGDPDRHARRRDRRIPATGPVVVVANHPHGLVDGMVMADRQSRPVGFQDPDAVLADRHSRGQRIHDPGALSRMKRTRRELGLQMRGDTIAHLKNGGVIILFPGGKVAMSEGWLARRWSGSGTLYLQDR